MLPIQSRQAHSAAPGAGCQGCLSGVELPFEFIHAYQPIVDLADRSIFAQEALIRGPRGEPASSVLARVNDENRYQFDQSSRVSAINRAARLGLRSRLSINFLPNAVYRPEVCIRSTLQAARACGFPVSDLIFEATEGERIADGQWLAAVFREYKRTGFLTAIDDFGAGYAGLALLADFQPDIVKLDMALVRNIDIDIVRQTMVRHIVRMCSDLGVRVVAEGIESEGERDFLYDTGIRLMQGYYFALPSLGSLVDPLVKGWIEAPERVRNASE